MSPEMHSVMQTIPNVDMINVVFVNEQLDPVIIVKYSRQGPINIKVVSNDTHITKIVCISDPRFDPEQVRGRGRKIVNPEKNIKKINETNKRIIYNELTSSLSQLPIYGISYVEQNTYATRTSYSDTEPIITHENGVFYIIDNRVTDFRVVRRPRQCHTFQLSELINFVLSLQIAPPEVDDNYLNDFLQNNPSVDIDTAKWYISGYTREQLCEIIKSSLEAMGHII